MCARGAWARSIPISVYCLARPARRAIPSGRAWFLMKAPAASGGRRASERRRMNRHQRDIDGAAETAARRIVVGGRVQGVGFRPFVYRKARGFDLTGWVRNGAGQVLIHVEGGARRISSGSNARLQREAPPLAKPHVASSDEVIIEGVADFRILSSDATAMPGRASAAGSVLLRRLSRGIAGPVRTALSLSVHELHAMRTALHDHRASALRPAKYIHGRL